MAFADGNEFLVLDCIVFKRWDAHSTPFFLLFFSCLRHANCVGLNLGHVWFSLEFFSKKKDECMHRILNKVYL